MLRSKILPAILVVVPAVFALTARTSLGEPQAQECRTTPGSSTPRGGHWYYRINHTDKQRCWYLSPAETRASGRAAAPLTSTPAPTPQKRSAGEAVTAVPPQVATAEVAFLQPSFGVREEQLVFVARWPEISSQRARFERASLECADFGSYQPPPPSNSYAESHAKTDTAVQMPLRWPIVEGDRAEQISVVESVLRSFSIAGGLLMVVLLLAGWAARFCWRARPSAYR